jgi:phosphate uptake regulator
MLKRIIAAWKADTFMQEITERFEEMLADAEFVFGHAWGSFTGLIVIDEVRQSIYDKDMAINRNERQIRRMLAEHLSINPKQDVSGCLAMMSLIKDVERIGDNSKNIFELTTTIELDSKEMKYIDRLTKVQERIAANFPLLLRAYRESDEAIANEILEHYSGIKEECKNLLKDLFSNEIQVREAVATTVIIRSFKRINSHICNVASGMVYPLDKIDFVRDGELIE